MRRLFILIFIIQCTSLIVSGQEMDSVTAIIDSARRPVRRPAQPVVYTDSLRNDSLKVDSAAIQLQAPAAARDSVCVRPLVRIPNWQIDPGLPYTVQIMREHPFFNFRDRPFIVPSHIKVFRGKETLFYVIAALVFAFALLKLAFAKYFSDLFRVFFRTTMKQRQIREQLMQTPLPSLAFNLFFVASAGLYADFLLFHYGFKPVDNFWILYLYCCVGLTAIYAVKFVVLKLCGWMFNLRQAADSYIFIVFIINKVIGIFLLPFVALLAFSDEPMRSIALTVSWCGIGLLFLYRFILGFSTVRNEVRFNLFHFLLYIFAFEVAPLLLIYRLLLFFFK